MQAKILTGIGAAALVALLIPFAALANGYTLAALWGWFVVPIFHVPALGLFAAMGIAALASFAFGHDGEVRRDNERKKADKSLSSRLTALSGLVINLSGLALARQPDATRRAAEAMVALDKTEENLARDFLGALCKAVWLTLCRSGVALFAGWLLSLCL